jgi:hypothetical protein
MNKLKKAGLIALGWCGIIVTIILYYVAIAPLFLLFK